MVGPPSLSVSRGTHRPRSGSATVVAYVIDTSALVRRYHRWESASDRVVEIHNQRTSDGILVVNRIVIVEMASAFANAERNRFLITAEKNRLIAEFREACVFEYRLIAVSRALIDTAAVVASEHQIRALDAIHIATALTVVAEVRPVGGVRFVTADYQQARVAMAIGLDTEVIV